MRIKPIAFNYGELLNDMPDTEVLDQRKNVVLKNKRYTMWGEHIDPDNKIMMLTSISVSREYSKETKENILTEWENYLHQYATNEQPEEILAKIEEKAKKEAEARKKAEESARKAEQAAKKEESTSKPADSKKNNSSKKEKVS